MEPVARPNGRRQDANRHPHSIGKLANFSIRIKQAKAWNHRAPR
jgi:hypothetical protein